MHLLVLLGTFCYVADEHQLFSGKELSALSAVVSKEGSHLTVFRVYIFIDGSHVTAFPASDVAVAGACPLLEAFDWQFAVVFQVNQFLAPFCFAVRTGGVGVEQHVSARTAQTGGAGAFTMQIVFQSIKALAGRIDGDVFFLCRFNADFQCVGLVCLLQHFHHNVMSSGCKVLLRTFFTVDVYFVVPGSFDHNLALGEERVFQLEAGQTYGRCVLRGQNAVCASLSLFPHLRHNGLVH